MSASSAREVLLQQIDHRIEASGWICIASRGSVTSSAELIALSHESIARSHAILAREPSPFG